MASKGPTQPPWTKPTSSATLPSLNIYNSLTRRKDPFVPIDPSGKNVTFYACGPTPYDDSHLGHAKNYVSIDIVRRILKDYFGFNVKFVMNSTNIDDKIIIRARQQFFLARFKEQQGDPKGPVTDAVKETARLALKQFAQKNLELLPEDLLTDQYSSALDKAYGTDAEQVALATKIADGSAATVNPKLKGHIKTARAAVEVVHGPGNLNLSDFYDKVDDILLPYLDAKYKTELDSSDYTIFSKLTEKYENRFFEDMGRLNVLYPDVLIKVTEVVPEIVDFVQKIIDNGFAYATSDGVWFDTDAFEKAGHPYARLEPWNKTDQELLADGEGSLAQTDTKKSVSHFALWKASKPGEPAWDSPWGAGRPGWHIECSVMASKEFGAAMDLHAGGVDLRFPHHDNELAQSEAYYAAGASGGNVQWVNYFIHTGHLSIAGMKMSKSLKNFTTIREALERPEWTPRTMRICFLQGAWAEGAEISEELIKQTAAWEKTMNNFFLKSLDVARSALSTTSARPGDPDQKLLNALEKAKTDLDAALCDSFDTATVMSTLAGLVNEYNVVTGVQPQTVLTLARWVTRIVTILGLDAEGDLADENRVGWSGLEIPEAAKPYVHPASNLRDQVRSIAKSGSLDYTTIEKSADATSAPTSSNQSSQPYVQVLQDFQGQVKKLAHDQAPAKDLLALCDKLRDVSLWDLGIYLEDRDHLGEKSAMIRPLDRSLVIERAEREQIAAAKAKAKAEKEAKAAEAEKALREKAKISHVEMYKTDEYSEWDKDGLPTKDSKGEEVTKNKKKKLVKDWEKQKKLHEEYLKSQ
ncbi:cysteinyl-tRNA synthetase [Lophiotrema nucula]|uniref:cysteine--tRNA ligase n=1 Tax=Lophiotrema nucula TaxID=690887 RepID=A0A6A5ZA34_9PLEO|nr:cysteinyl-tRNA synthetase [Lophiotrema nucula]